MVFDSKAAYTAYAQQELGEQAASAISYGYYSLRSNRVIIYDLTEATNALSTRGANAAQINRLLSQPGAERTVATIIHEATHQIAYNSGLHQRYADIPLWLNEGLAIYFETPDLRSSQGWRGIGGVNRVRLAEFRQYLTSRPDDSLETLLLGSERFRNPRTAVDAYAEAWAVNYFLIRRYPKQFTEYLKIMAQKRPIIADDPETRRAEFQRCFGTSPSELDDEFLRYMRGVR